MDRLKTEQKLTFLFIDYRFLQYSPSMVAAGSLYVARRYISVTPTWTSRLESVSGYSKELLEPVIKLFEDCNSIA